MNFDTGRNVAGATLVGGATLMALGFTTAEAFYPGYSTSAQTISALGAAGAPAASQAVFNAVMVVSGLILLVGTYGLHRAYGRRQLTGLLASTSIGVAGVGLFPSQTGALHFIAAALAFGGAGLSALKVATVVRGRFSAVSAVLGVVELVAFVLFIALGGSNPLDVGGLERWVAYLALLWATAFGGYLLGNTDRI